MIIRTLTSREVADPRSINGSKRGGFIMKRRFAWIFAALMLIGLLNSSPISPAEEKALKRKATSAQKRAVELLIKGRKLLDGEVDKLEEKLRANPDDLSTRTQLLGYYSRKKYESASARKNRQRHMIWIIQNHPSAIIAGLPEARLDRILDKEAYHKAKELWLKQVEAHRKNTAILGNAANFFLIQDMDISEDFLKKAQALEPDNPEWSERLGHFYLLNMQRTSDEARMETARQALKQFERSLASTVDERERSYKLKYLAKAAFEAGDMKKARAYATELLNKAIQNNWNYGNAVHHGNLILGRLALKSGDLEKAKEHLIEAGKTPGSPQLNSFGPNMTLAKELLEKGEREIVIEYFQLCAKFWKMRRDRLEKWTSIVKEGGIPDFRANLYY